MYSNKELRERRKFQWYNNYEISQGVHKRLGKECRQRTLPQEFLQPTHEIPDWMAISSTGKQIAKALEKHSRLECLVVPVTEPLRRGDLIITEHNENGNKFYIGSRISSGIEEIYEEKIKDSRITPISMHTRIFANSEYDFEVEILRESIYSDNVVIAEPEVIEYTYEDIYSGLPVELENKDNEMRKIIEKIQLNPNNVVSLKIEHKNNSCSMYYRAEELEMEVLFGLFTISNKYEKQINIDVYDGFNFMFATDTEDFKIEEYTNIVGKDVLKISSEGVEMSVTFL